jgi:hypothetical protein
MRTAFIIRAIAVSQKVVVFLKYNVEISQLSDVTLHKYVLFLRLFCKYRAYRIKLQEMVYLLQVTLVAGEGGAGRRVGSEGGLFMSLVEHIYSVQLISSSRYSASHDLAVAGQRTCADCF